MDAGNNMDGKPGKFMKKGNKKRQLKILEHIMKKEDLENLTRTGYSDGKMGN